MVPLPSSIIPKLYIPKDGAIVGSSVVLFFFFFFVGLFFLC